MQDHDGRDDRLAILLDQLDAAWEMLEARLTERQAFASERGSSQLTLTDEEYFWEPVPGCWSIRRREEATTNKAWGNGDWVMDYESPTPQPPPVTTIAWRLGHLAQWLQMRYDYTFGAHTMTLDAMVWPSTARDAVDTLTESYNRWRSGLEGMSSADLDMVGRSQMQYGLDPGVRFVDLLAWTNLEFGHHAAEIALLRDLYRANFSHSLESEAS